MVKPLSRPCRHRAASRSGLRRNFRIHVRRLTRSSIRNLPGFRPGPDDLSQALTAFRRAIHAHRRLARLAPEFFDATEIDRLAHRRQKAAEWMALWEPALNAAYGPSPPGQSRSDPLEDLPQPPKSRRTQRAVEREFADWRFWMTAGRLALARYQHRRPHDLPSLTRIARLIQIGFDFAHLAWGSFDRKAADAEESFRHAQALADLERAYGSPIPGEDTPEESTAKAESGLGSTDLPADLPQPTRSPLVVLPPADTKRDLLPCRFVIGPHGFWSLQPIEVPPPPSQK